MKLFINDYDLEDIDLLKKKIEESDIVFIEINTKNKKMLFALGLVFALNKRIIVSNKSEVLEEVNKYKIDIAKPSKSFNLMGYAWEKLSNPEFKYSSNERMNTFDQVIENFKRSGSTHKIEDKIVNQNKIFMICPVRNASEEQLEDMSKYVSDSKKCGYDVYNPNTDTVQTDLLGGLSICKQNATAIKESSGIHIFYDKNSMGSMFDLGCAYAYSKPLTIINGESIEYDESDFGDNLIKNWNKNQSLALK